MINVSRGVLLAGVLAACAVLASADRVAAQGAAGAPPQGEPVKITTVDGVDLHGTFYKSAKTKAPVVIMLHALGDQAVNSKAYRNLAETLQPNYSVLLFDFRGHGKSKEIDPAIFWKHPLNNQRTIKGANLKKTTIEYNDFIKEAYTPVLVNDIAAVKAYLDRRNDAGDCNTSSTILIGAETGAMLGTIWLNSEWHLTRMIPNPNNPVLMPVASPNPEGKDVIACIWLSLTSKHGSFSISLLRTLDTPVRVRATPTVFMSADKDEVGSKVAKELEKKLKVKDDKKYDYITAYPIQGNTTLKGINLIQKSLKTDAAVLEYLDQVVEKKGNEWGKRDFKTSQYMWLMNGIPSRPAKQIGPNNDPNNLLFDGYERFYFR
jgi:hypothetical protein